MKHLLFSLFLVFLAAAPAWSKPLVLPSNNPARTQTTTIKFPISDTADTEAIPVSGYCSVRYEQASGDDASLYAVTTSSAAASSGTLIAAFTSSTTTATTFTAGTRWVKAVATDATAGGSVMQIDCAPLTGSGGGGQDADQDGLYEFAYLWDADGDGSTEVTCTAKDTPDSACKAAGEIIYGDAADDINCAVHGCSTGSGQMENNGTLYLKAGVVYVNFPCWEPTNVTNTRGGVSDDNEHDSTADAAYSLCPATPDPDTTRRFYTISLMGWQGEIIGGGTDTRNPATTTNYKRDQGTYLVDDRGPDWESGTNSGNNTWFGHASFIRGITIGFDSGALASTSSPTATGELSGDGDSKGYGTISGTQTISSYIDNQYLCVANTSGLDTLVAGDIIEVQSTSSVADSLSSPTVVAALRVRDTPSSTCNAAAGIQVPIGGRTGYLGTNNSYFATSPPYTTQFTNGMVVVATRSDHRDSTARIANLNIEPQDWWAEAGGDCAEQLDAADSGETPWTPALDGDSTNADYDCDTNPLVGLYGGGAPIIEDVVFRNWHQYAVDGNSNVGTPQVRRSRFFHGKGGPIMDAGSGWAFKENEIHDSHFADNGASVFGPGVVISGTRIYNSSGYSFVRLTDTAVGELVEDTKFENSAFEHAFNLVCGARRNTFRNTVIENSHGLGNVSLLENGVLARIECATTSNPIEQNVFDGFTITGVEYYQLGGTGNVTAAVMFDTNATIATPGSAAISRNVFMNGVMKNTKSGHSACLFAAIDDDVNVDASDRFRAGVPFDYSHEDVLALNTFSNNSVHASGGGGAVDLVYCGCSINTTGNLTADEYFEQCSATVGSGSGIGANAIGCMNLDNNAVPAAGQTCS